MVDERCRQAVEASEQHAENLISQVALDLSSAAAEEAYEDASVEPETEDHNTAAIVAHAASYATSPNLGISVLDDALWAILEVSPEGTEGASLSQANLLRDIFGNPFRSVTLAPQWRTSTVVAIAQQMYESRDFSAMPILADALQDAGCDNDDILTHCRDANGVHVRGCWVIDLILGKE